MTPKKRKQICLIAIIIIGIFSYLLYVKHLAQKKILPPLSKPEVSIIEVNPADLNLEFEYAGRTIGSKQIEVRPRVSGILQKRAYIEGSFVKKGDLLFKVDPAPFEAELSKAQALLAKTKNDWNRASKLFEEDALSAKERDDAKSAYEQAKAAAETAKINLSYTKVTAQVSGVTSKEGLSEGSIVSADSTLLTTISQFDPIYVYFSIPDSESIDQRREVASGSMILPKNKKLTAEIRDNDGNLYKQKGVINFTDNIIDPDTGTISSRAVLKNSDGEILPGQFVRVMVTGLVKKNAVTIPDRAIMQGPQGVFVYVVDEQNKVGIAPITLGVLKGKDRVIESGLNKGDKVVVEGMIKIRPGAEVVTSEYQQSS